MKNNFVARNNGNSYRSQKGKNEVLKGTPFINPYTFVPISTKEPERRKIEKEEKRLSGKIVCDLSVGSSLFIPNTSKKFRYYDGNKDHFFHEFFSYEDLSEWKDDIPDMPPAYPRIPGSELRGMVRNVYEQLTNSCFSIIDKKNLPSRRTNRVKEAGLLDLKTDILYEGDRILLNAGKGKSPKGRDRVGAEEGAIQTGDRVFFTSTSKNGKIYADKVRKPMAGEEKPEGWREGYVLIGEAFGEAGRKGSKSYDSIIAFSGEKAIRELTPKDYERLEEVLRKYIENPRAKSKAHFYYNQFLTENRGKERLLPVFYSIVGENMYLSPSMITREVFDNTISDLLKQNREHRCCDGKDGKWCPACRLFGMVGDSQIGANVIASRLRFSDSEVFHNPKFMTPRILQILGTPRYSSTEFYLEKPLNGIMWNYDYLKKKDGTEEIYEPELKGRKVYWIGKDRLGEADSVKYASKASNLKQRTAIRALKEGNTEFSVYFEDLSEEELKCLLFSLDLEERKDAFHRIGKGKPYGMGAVKVSVKNLIFHEYHFKDGRVEAEEVPGNLSEYRLQENDFSGKYKKEKEEIFIYSVMLDKSEGDLVAYPTIEGDDRIFKWFGKNRGSVKNEKIESVLPKIYEDKKLKKYIDRKGK